MDFSKKPKSLERAAEEEFNDSLLDIARSQHKCPAEGNEDFFVLKGKEDKEEETEAPQMKKAQPENEFSGNYGGNSKALKNVVVGCACCGWRMSGDKLVSSKSEDASYETGTSYDSGSSSGSYSDGKNKSYGNANNSGNYGRK